MTVGPNASGAKNHELGVLSDVARTMNASVDLTTLLEGALQRVAALLGLGETAARVTAARSEGRSVIAVGTTVVRALESAWDGRRVRPAVGLTRLFIHPGRPVRSVDSLLTGLHEPLSSHLAMLHALAPEDFVRGGYAEAMREGYLWHEFGDSHLLLPRAA